MEKVNAEKIGVTLITSFGEKCRPDTEFFDTEFFSRKATEYSYLTLLGLTG